MMEQQLADVFPWAQWLWLAGVGIVVILALYVIGEFVRKIWRSICR